jgi:hypothetical protein
MAAAVRLRSNKALTTPILFFQNKRFERMDARLDFFF